MDKIIFLVFFLFFFSCSHKKIEMKIKKIPNIEIVTGTKSKIEYFEVFDYNSCTDDEILQEIKIYCKTNISADSLHKYDEYQCYFYKHTSFVNYSSFAGKNTSNFEEGGIRDWDNPSLYNMKKYLISKVFYEKNTVEYVIYKNDDIILNKTDVIDLEK